MTDHDKATPHEELLARLENHCDIPAYAWADNQAANEFVTAMGEAAAAIRSLQTKLEAERNGWLQANAPGGWIDDLRIKAMSDIQPCCGEFDTCEHRCVPLALHWKERATAAEQALAKCFEKTRERCAKVADKYAAHDDLVRAGEAIRALTQEPAEPSDRSNEYEKTLC